MHAGLLQRNHLAMLPFTIPLPKLTLPPFQPNHFVSLRARVQIWMEDGGCRAGPARNRNSPPTGFLVKGIGWPFPQRFEAMTHATKREVVKQKELSTKRTSSVKYHIDLWRMTFILFIKETFGDTTWSWVETPFLWSCSCTHLPITRIKISYSCCCCQMRFSPMYVVMNFTKCWSSAMKPKRKHLNMIKKTPTIQLHQPIWNSI